MSESAWKAAWPACVSHNGALIFQSADRCAAHLSRDRECLFSSGSLPFFIGKLCAPSLVSLVFYSAASYLFFSPGLCAPRLVLLLQRVVFYFLRDVFIVWVCASGNGTAKNSIILLQLNLFLYMLPPTTVCILFVFITREGKYRSIHTCKTDDPHTREMIVTASIRKHYSFLSLQHWFV